MQQSKTVKSTKPKRLLASIPQLPITYLDN